MTLALEDRHRATVVGDLEQSEQNSDLPAILRRQIVVEREHRCLSILKEPSLRAAVEAAFRFLLPIFRPKLTGRRRNAGAYGDRVRSVGYRLDLAEDRLHVVAVRIEHEGGVVARRVTFGGVAKTRRPIVGPACLQSGRVEGV